MKLLSMALGEHDSNFSFYDGKNVKYYKTERVHQIKHHTLTDLNSWKKEIFDVWGLNFNEVDEIAIVIDPWIYKLPYEKYFFPVKKFNSLDVNCEVTQINHHYAHALSSRMLGESSIDFVFDGFGDPDVSWSVFKNDKLIEKGSVEKNGSLGILIAEAAVFMGVKAKHGLDLAGKFMGLQSYGNIDYEYLKFLNKFDLYNVKNVFNYNNWVSHKKDETVANLTKLDWARTIHFRVGEILVNYFKTHASSNDTISFSGGVAQNIIWNTELRKQFPKIIIPPH
jgi:carbamoyltransferase